MQKTQSNNLAVGEDKVNAKDSHGAKICLDPADTGTRGDITKLSLKDFER